MRTTSEWTARRCRGCSKRLGGELIAAVAIPFLLLMLAALGGNMIQHRLVWSVEALAPKLSKISPLAGFKRLFSKQALANFAKGLVKLVLIGAVLTALMWPERDRLEGAGARRSGGGAAARPVAGARSCWAPWSPSWRWSPPPITCSSTGNGTSGRKCRCGN